MLLRQETFGAQVCLRLRTPEPCGGRAGASGGRGCLQPEAFARTPEASGGRGEGLRVLQRPAVLRGQAVAFYENLRQAALRLGAERPRARRNVST